MPTKPEGQRFFNSNDIVTKAQFEQEAKLWSDAFKSVNRPQANFTATLTGLGIVLNFVFAILWLVVLVLGKIVNWLFDKNE